MAHRATAGKKSSGCCSFAETSSFPWLTFTIVISCAIPFVYLLQSLVVSRGECLSRSVHTLSTVVAAHTESNPNLMTPPEQQRTPPASQSGKYPTELSRVVFGIAGAAKNWPDRKNYIRGWYNLENNNTRAIVWLDKSVNGTWERDAPPFKISEDVSHHPGFNHRRSTGIRIARIVSEMVRLGLRDVDWFVMGDDDTFFFPGNVVKVLSKYDHTQMYYIGSNSETHYQNLLFSFNMAFGGGGFAVSFPLAQELAKMQDSCIARYPGMFGSDDRIFACMSELGVTLTKEPGFHQMDIRGSAVGLLAAHPQSPLVSLHHMDMMAPIFPGLSRHASMGHILQAAKVESASVLQQSICYARNRSWSISISWGYVVQAYRGFLTPRELETPLRTFQTIQRRNGQADFPFNTRELPKDACQQPAMFYMKSVDHANTSAAGEAVVLESVYLRNEDLRVTRPACQQALEPLTTVRRIRVVKKPVAASWFEAPRRLCCEVKSWSKDSIELELRDCQAGETILTSSMH